MENIASHERPTLVFKDILEDRRIDNDLMWVSRHFEWTKAYDKTKESRTPVSLKKHVLKSPRVIRLIEEEAKERNTTVKEVNLAVHSILNEIACSKQLPVVRWLGYVLLKIMKKTVTALYVNEEKLLKIKAEMGKNPVLFMPSHRSYADFILMAFVMFNYSIDIPCVAAGMDFHSMWLMGRLLRDCSAFFMRRSFADDKLYKTVFEEYVKKLVAMGDSPIEFFIEGTRSRSGKSLVPKFGLLTMVMDTFFSGEVPDITIVPVNISYDRTLEELLFAYEMLGVAKPKESTSGLIKGINMMDERYGNVYVNFCDPISAHQYVWEMSRGDVSYCRRNSDNEQQQIVHLGHTIVDRQQRSAVLSCFNVLALVLSERALCRRPPLPLASAASDVAWLSSVLSVLGAYVRRTGDTLGAVKEAVSVHKSLVRLDGDEIHLVSVHSPLNQIDPSRIKGHQLSEPTMRAAVPLLTLQQYVNPCMHFVAGPAIITVVMRHLGDSGCIARDHLFKRYQFLRTLLAQEFVFHKAWEVEEFEDALQRLELVNIIESAGEERLALGNHKKLQLLISNLLHPFLSGYLGLCRHLRTMPENEDFCEKAVLRSAQARLEERLVGEGDGEDVLDPRCLSLDLLGCALASLANLGAIQRRRTNGEVLYRVLHRKLDEVVSELGGLVVRPSSLQEPLKLDGKHSLLVESIPRAKL